jgi:hypothetical protein
MKSCHGLFLSLILLAGCSSSRTSPSPETTTPSVLGKWHIAVQMTVMNQADNGGQTYTTTVNEDEWEMDAKRSKPVVIYYPDLRYHTVYYDISIGDSVHMLGTYEQLDDTLIARDAQGLYEPLVSKLTFTNPDQFEMVAFIDTDMDGKKDDEIRATLKRAK